MSGSQNGRQFDKLNGDEGAQKWKMKLSKQFFAILNNNHRRCVTSKENFGVVFVI